MYLAGTTNPIQEHCGFDIDRTLHGLGYAKSFKCHADSLGRLSRPAPWLHDLRDRQVADLGADDDFCDDHGLCGRGLDLLLSAVESLGVRRVQCAHLARGVDWKPIVVVRPD